MGVGASGVWDKVLRAVVSELARQPAPKCRRYRPPFIPGGIKAQREILTLLKKYSLSYNDVPISVQSSEAITQNQI